VLILFRLVVPLSMPLRHQFLTLTAALLCPVAALLAQQPAPGPASELPPAAVVQEKVREWVRAKQAIRAEAVEWESEKESLARLNDVRQKEIERLDALITAAGGRVKEAEKELGALREEKASLTTRRKQLATEVAALESSIRGAAASFPAPLREKLADALARLEHPAAEDKLQDRWRDVLVILGEASRFDHVITIHPELREIGGKQIAVEVVYLGLGQAWYADQSGKHAGTGRPGEAGWSWQEEPALHGRVREVIAMQRKEKVPGFVALPVEAK
jgi:hypothetical protein